MTLPMTEPIRRALTRDEMIAVIGRFHGAADTGQLLYFTVAGVYDLLLADRGLSLDTLLAGQTLEPGLFLIPARQWQTITGAAAARAAEWGTGPELALDLINVMPATYDDPEAPLPELPPIDYRPELLEVHIARDAADVIAAATAHVQALGDFYGRTSEHYLQAAGSWLAAMSRLLSMSYGAGTRVLREAELSLLVHTGGGFTYALIFHGDIRRCTAGDGCAAVIADDGTVHTLYSTATVAHHTHQPSFPLEAPRPGSWSAHS